MKPLSKVPLDKLVFVTVTSQTLSRGGPPFLAVIVAVMVLSFTTITLEMDGVGPLPLDNVTEAPETNPVPLIVTLTNWPLSTEFRLIESTETPAETSFTVTEVVELSKASPSLTVNVTEKVPIDVYV